MSTVFSLDEELQKSLSIHSFDEHIRIDKHNDRNSHILAESNELLSDSRDVIDSLDFYNNSNVSSDFSDYVEDSQTISNENTQIRNSFVIPIKEFIANDTLEGSLANTPIDPQFSAHLPLSPSVKAVGLKDFDILSVIGKGAYGKVFLVRKKGLPASNDPDQANNIYAMKVLRKAHIVLHDDKGAEHTQNERNILEDVRHPFIVKLYYAFQTSHKLYLILSYAPGGELFTYLSQERMVTDDVASFYSGEILVALQHLHSLGIIYRDLKPENVLLCKDGHIMLTDFGLSKIAIDANTVCGTVEFMSPEIVAEKTYDRSVDFWSLGIMIYDMLTGSPPFVGNNRKKVMDAIITKKLSCPNYMTPFAKDICIKLLKKNPRQRLGSGPDGASEIMKHQFYRKINWVKLKNKEGQPPLVPKLNDLLDTSNFLSDFTSLPIDDTPPKADATGINSDMHYFRGFSFVHDEIV